MTLFEAILFGIIQGLTELFPVSSSGHLTIMGNLFGISGATSNYTLMTVFLHFGTLLSVVIVYWPELCEMGSDAGVFIRARLGQGSDSRHYESLRLLLLIGCTCLPLLFLLPLMDYLNLLTYSSYFVGLMMIVSGVILLISDHLRIGEKDERNMTFSDALLLGLCQLAAAIPGLSRVGVDMAAGKAMGLHSFFALKYAYLLSIPVIFGMNIVHLTECLSQGFAWSDVPLYLVGMLSAMLTGMFAMRFARNAAEHQRFRGFAYYCFVAGALFIILTMIF